MSYPTAAGFDYIGVGRGARPRAAWAVATVGAMSVQLLNAQMSTGCDTAHAISLEVDRRMTPRTPVGPVEALVNIAGPSARRFDGRAPTVPLSSHSPGCFRQWQSSPVPPCRVQFQAECAH